MPLDTVGQATRDGRPAVEARHDGVVRSGHRHDPARRDRLEQAGRTRGLDAEKLRVARTLRNAEVARHGGGEGADADLHDHEVRPRLPSPFELVVDLPEHGRVALDHPRRDPLVAGPGHVRDDERALSGLFVGALYGLIVGAPHHDHLGPSPAMASRRASTISSGTKILAPSPRSPATRQGAAVVAVGGRHEVEGPQGFQLLLEFLDRLPIPERAPR